ncbi:hypothetical protein D3C84_1031560 [compost metagenome]
MALIGHDDRRHPVDVEHLVVERKHRRRNDHPRAWREDQPHHQIDGLVGTIGQEQMLPGDLAIISERIKQ